VNVEFKSPQHWMELSSHQTHSDRYYTRKEGTTDTHRIGDWVSLTYVLNVIMKLKIPDPY
jgi:hypothetical protein